MRECSEYIEKALAILATQSNHSEHDELRLLVVLGTVLPITGGPLPKTDIVWTKALQLAEKLNNAECQLQALYGLYVYRLLTGNFGAADALANQFYAAADKKGDAAARLIGHRLIGTTQHFLGYQINSRHHIEQALTELVVPPHQSWMSHLSFNHRMMTRHGFSRILWIQGFPDQAIHAAQNSLDEARAAGDPLTLCIALATTTCPITLYLGDLVETERLVSTLLEESGRYQLTMFNALGRCLKGALLLQRGDVAGLVLLQASLDWLREARIGLWHLAFRGILANGMAAAGQTGEAGAGIEEALERCEHEQECWCLPELLRIKGEICRLQDNPDAIQAAEGHFIEALELAREQGALFWELRVATSIAELWNRRSKTAEAIQLLSSVYHRFSEGFETSDLKKAHALIHKLEATLT